MISMTGYGYLEVRENDLDITIEIKSVNNRYTDINIKIPYLLNSYEKNIRNLILQKAQRGKIDINIYIKDKNQDYKINVNLPLAKKYYDCFYSIINEFNLKDDIRLSYFLKAEGVIEIDEKKDTDQLWEILEKNIKVVLEEFYLSKKAEGEETKKHILNCINIIEEKLNFVKDNSKDFIKIYEDKIKKKIKELVGDGYDENRILMEVALLGSKCDITEELERLSSHIKQFKIICEKEEAIGRQLEFISQEINREINTIGSKANSIIISEQIIDMKTELEKIKEQIRNIE